MPDRCASGVLRRPVERVPQTPVHQPGAGNPPPALLLDLVAVNRVVQEIGEVLEQVQPALQRVGGHAGRSRPARLQPVERQAVARGPAGVGVVDGAEARQTTRLDRAQRDLVGRVPVGVVPHAGDGEPVLQVALAVAHHGVHLAHIVGPLPRPVVRAQLQGHQHVAGAHPRRDRPEHAPPPLPAAADAQQRALEHVLVADVGRAGRGEVAVLGEVGSLGVLHAADELGNEQVHVTVAVGVRAGRLVHRHAGKVGGEVGAVIEIEAAQVVLVRLALAAVLAGDEPRHGFENLAGAHDGARLELLGGDGAFAGRGGDAHQVVARVLQVGDVAERPAAGDDHVGGQAQGQDRVVTVLAVRHLHVPAERGEVHQSERQARRSFGHALDAPGAGVIGDGVELKRAGLYGDGNTGKHAPGLVDDRPGQAAG